jgi:glutathione peroxidase
MKLLSSFKSVAVLIVGSLFAGNNASAQAEQQPIGSVYDVQINSLMGDPINLTDYKGKKILFVNVASKCGYTPQYKGLQELHKAHGDQLVVIGVPCNQFMGQEPGSADDIQAFCEKNYGVEFLITEKVKVKGGGQHPLYQWLTQKSNNGVEDTKVKWNFNKYLIDEEGNYVEYFGSKVKPMTEPILSKL